MIFILTGPVHSGKTSLLKKAVVEWKEGKIKVDGFLSLAVREKGKMSGYDLFDLKNETSLPLLRRKGNTDWQRTGSYFFLPSGLARAERIILRSREAELGVMDEIGPLELAGKGFWPALLQVIFRPGARILLVIREAILNDFRLAFGQSEIKVFDVTGQGVLAQLVETVQKNVFPSS